MPGQKLVPMRKKNARYINLDIQNISELDLTNPINVRGCLSEWETILELSHEYTKVNDLKIELQQKIKYAALTEMQKMAIFYNLTSHMTQRETGQEMKTGARQAAKLVEQGIKRIASCEGNPDAKRF